MIALFSLAAAAQNPLISEAKELFANQSTNPSGVQFRNIRMVGGAVCGEINKPNELGGYWGFTSFIYRDRGNWAVGHKDYYWFSDNGQSVNVYLLKREHDLEERRLGPVAAYPKQHEMLEGVIRARDMLEPCKIVG